MIDVEVKGLMELQRKTDQMVKDLHGTPILNAMRDSTLIVARKARINVVVDTGKLKASILPEVRATPNEIMGVVGSNVVYAPYIETGTRPHFPPILAIATWVHHKGLAGKFSGRSAAGERSIAELTIAMFIAFKIAKHGTKAKKFLEPAFRDSESAINNRFDRAVSEIVEK